MGAVSEIFVLDVARGDACHITSIASAIHRADASGSKGDVRHSGHLCLVVAAKKGTHVVDARNAIPTVSGFGRNGSVRIGLYGIGIEIIVGYSVTTGICSNGAIDQKIGIMVPLKDVRDLLN